jgi:hypothetical protein
LSTTWVFIGLIGGREIAINLARDKEGHSHKWRSLRMIGKDFTNAFIGLIISVILASGANPAIRNEIWKFISLQ